MNRTLNYGLLLALAFISRPIAGQEARDVVPLSAAHAHNDYLHERPLFDALDHGFCSVEADIYLVEGELLVAHEPSELQPGRSLQSLYLDPLKSRVEANGGRVYRDGPPFTLFIDIKRDGASVYRTLQSVLPAYKEMLCSVEDGRVVQRAIQIVISGDRPKSDIASDQIRYVAIDGRLSDLDSENNTNLIPVISDRWFSHFRWRGEGEIPMLEREKLHSIVGRAHAMGRRVRFWATPETPVMWNELMEAEVDLINTDQLDRLSEFLNRRTQSVP